jgi:hypothetical protein
MTLRAGILMAAPVWGLRPVRAARSETVTSRRRQASRSPSIDLVEMHAQR